MAKLEEEIYQKNFRNDYHKAFVNIIYTNNWLNQFQNEMLKRYDITPQQYNILRILRGQHPNYTSIKLIKERMLDKMSDASRIVEKLRKKHLITRTEAIDDRRKVDVVITARGMELLSEIDTLNDNTDAFLSKLDIEEISKLNVLLDKLRG